MKTVRDVMTSNVVSVSPSNTIRTAVMLMKSHHVGGLPVTEDGIAVGVLDYQDLLGRDETIPVQHVMHKEFIPIPPDLSIADAADLISKVGLSRLLVVEEGRVIGTVTPRDLLPELGRSVDVLTGLARADGMRDYGVAALRSGREITVIFIDIDDFRAFNKKYGHVVGDLVIKHVADVLKANVAEDTDFLCRYAGDEFVIVTLRHSKEAKELADLLEERIKDTPDPALAGLPDGPVTVTASIGVHGGKRTKEREEVHYAATLDNLINLASKSCMLAKGKKGMVVSVNGDAPPGDTGTSAVAAAESTARRVDERRLKILGMNLSWQGGSLASAEIELGRGEESYSHTAKGFAMGRNALRLVAEAVAGAVTHFLPEGFCVAVDSVSVVESGGADDIVLATAVLVTPQGETRLAGTSIVRQDAYRAAAAAVLDSLNRQVSELL